MPIDRGVDVLVAAVHAAPVVGATTSRPGTSGWWVGLFVVVVVAAIGGLAYQQLRQRGRMVASIAADPSRWASTLAGYNLPPSPTGPFLFRCGSPFANAPSYLVAFDAGTLVLVRNTGLGRSPRTYSISRPPTIELRPGMLTGGLVIGGERIASGPILEVARFLAWCGWPVFPAQGAVSFSPGEAVSYGWIWPVPPLVPGTSPRPVAVPGILGAAMPLLGAGPTGAIPSTAGSPFQPVSPTGSRAPVAAPAGVPGTMPPIPPLPASPSTPAPSWTSSTARSRPAMSNPAPTRPSASNAAASRFRPVPPSGPPDHAAPAADPPAAPVVDPNVPPYLPSMPTGIDLDDLD